MRRKRSDSLQNSKDIIQKLIPKCHSYRHLARELNTSATTYLAKLVRKWGFDTSHFTKSFPGSTKYTSFIGKVYGKLLILDIVHKNKSIKPLYYAICQCDCGKEKEILITNVIKSRTVSCGCIHNYPTHKYNKCWKGIGEMSGVFFSRLKRGAKNRNIEFNITKEYLWDIFLKQNQCCALTGLELTFASDSCISDTIASVDRIDSSKGYVEGNVQWVHKIINFMKHKLPQDDFIRACKLVANYRQDINIDNINFIDDCKSVGQRS